MPAIRSDTPVFQNLSFPIDTYGFFMEFKSVTYIVLIIKQNFFNNQLPYFISEELQWLASTGFVSVLA